MMAAALQQLVFSMLYAAALASVAYGSSSAAVHQRHGLRTYANVTSHDPSAVLEHVTSRSFLSCCTLCRRCQQCGGVAYTDTGQCSLLSRRAVSCGYLTGECSTCHYKVLLYDDSMPPATGIDCLDLLQQGYTADRVYIIDPPGVEPFLAYCDMSDGGWTVIQRRVDDSVDFYRGWNDYVAGFGDLCGNQWAGLNNIHALTPASQSVELLVTMETFENEAAEAHYSSFHVDDAASGFRLSVSGYSGTAGDSMAYHDQQRFTTKDHDADASEGNCAASFSGAWWYASCHAANPNGLYLHGETPLHAKGVVWYNFKGHDYSLRTMQFKVRRVN